MSRYKPSPYGPRVEPFKDWRGIRMYRASCNRHGWSLDCYIEQNAKDALTAHEVQNHGRNPRPSEWTLAMGTRL